MSVIEPQAPSGQLGFSRVGAAAPATVVAWRGEFGAWLHDHLDLDAERRSDIVLAVDEALSNAAEFAYLNSAGGKVTLDVRYSSHQEQLDIEVSDSGTWRESGPENRSLARGRGIQLMRALSDEFSLQQGSGGTTVLMSFMRCPSDGATST